MELHNLRDYSVAQLDELIREAELIREEKREFKRSQSELSLNDEWDNVQDLICGYEDEYVVMMHIQDKRGAIQYFKMNGNNSVRFKLCFPRKKEG